MHLTVESSRDVWLLLSHCCTYMEPRLHHSTQSLPFYMPRLFTFIGSLDQMTALSMFAVSVADGSTSSYLSSKLKCEEGIDSRYNQPLQESSRCLVILCRKTTKNETE